MFKKAEKIPLTNNTDVDTERVMLEISYTSTAALLSYDKLPFFIRLHRLDYTLWHFYSGLEIT